MDEKHQDLEKLRQQINPDVLARVAAAMGQSLPDAQPTTASKPTPASTPSKSASRGSLSNLKARMNRKESVETAPVTETPGEKGFAAFIVYDPSHFRARQLAAFIQKMGFPQVTVCSDPQQFMRSLVLNLNDKSCLRNSIVLYDEYFPGMQALLASDSMQQLRNALPTFDELKTFVMFEEDHQPESLEGHDPKYSLSMRLTPEFSGKRIRRLLDLPV